MAITSGKTGSTSSINCGIDSKMVKNIFPKIGGWLRLSHAKNDQLSIMAGIIWPPRAITLLQARLRDKPNQGNLSHLLGLQIGHHVAFKVGRLIAGSNTDLGAVVARNEWVKVRGCTKKKDLPFRKPFCSFLVELDGIEPTAS
jgi:hypothetical protein